MSLVPKKVQILDPLVAERIAAGEVIERPSSIVKELVENALDAGATEIAVILEDGGKRLIEVLDNGTGMDAENLKLCTLRHATSKIRAVEDLERLTSLGFRGEALPSVAAVAELSITTRTAEMANGSRETLEWKNGDVAKTTFGHFLGSPHGTRMLVRGLFSQIPARLKFLKSASSEVSHVREWIERLALTHPETGFKLLSEDRTILQLRPGTVEDRVKQILGDGNDYPLVSLERHDQNGISVKAYWLQGLSSPQTRKLVQIINKRAVRDRLVQQAMLSAFRQALLPGQFPAVALFLDLPPHLLDVNVHPTKTELRFLNSSQIFRAVDQLLEDLIAQHGVAGYAARPTSLFPANFSVADSVAGSATAPAFRPSFAAESFAPTSNETATAAPGFVFRQPSAEAPAAASTSGALFPESTHPFRFERFSGLIFQTYLLYDLGDELAMIDQHAAHERIRYETLKARALKRAQAAQSQNLLLPEVVSFPPERRLDLEARLPLIAQLGFEAELFGDDKLLFRGIPPEWGQASLRTRLMSLVERLISLEDRPEKEAPLLLDERLFEKLASEACHSAVRAGDRLSPEQAQRIVDQLFECEHPWNCPHGRPTIARVPRARFEEWFQRRV